MNSLIFKSSSLSFVMFIGLNICTHAQPDNTCFYNLKNVKEKESTEYLYESCIENRKSLIEDSIRIAVLNRTSEVSRFDMNSEHTNSYYHMFKSILSNLGLEQNFYFFSCYYFKNACATAIHTVNGVERVVMIDNQFLNLLGDNHHSEYPAASIIAHEIAHHLNNHVLSDVSTSRYKQELEADEFSGYILNLIGASLEEALIALNYYGSVESSSTHPSLAARIYAVKKGYNNAKSHSEVAYEKLNRNQLLDMLDKTKNSYSRLIIYSLLAKQEADPELMLSIIQSQGLIYYTVKLHRNAISKFEYALNFAKTHNLPIDKNESYLHLAECSYSINRFLKSVEYCKLIINDLKAPNILKLQAKNLYLKILMDLKCIHLNEAQRAFDNIFSSDFFPTKESDEYLSSVMLEQYKLDYQLDSTIAFLLKDFVDTDKDFFDLMQHLINIQKYDECLRWIDHALNNLEGEMDPIYKSYYMAKVYGYKATSLYLIDRINEAYDIVSSRKEDIIINPYISEAIKMKLDIVDYHLLR